MDCMGVMSKELANEPAYVKLLFIMGEALQNCRTTVWKRGRVAIQRGQFITSFNHAKEWMNGNTDGTENECFSHWQIRQGFKRLEELNYWKVEGKNRFTIVTVLGSDRTVNRTVSRTVNTPIKQHELIDLRTVNHTQPRNSLGVVLPAFDVSLGVDVPSVVYQNEEGTRTQAREAPPCKPNVKSTEPYEPSPPGIPDLPLMVLANEFMTDYNRLCPRLIKCRFFTDKREKKFQAAFKMHPTGSYWLDVLNAAAQSSFLAGDNDRGWRADIDFVIRCNVEIIEGKYLKAKNAEARPVLPPPPAEQEPEYDPELAEEIRRAQQARRNRIDIPVEV